MKVLVMVSLAAMATQVACKPHSIRNLASDGIGMREDFDKLRGVKPDGSRTQQTYDPADSLNHPQPGPTQKARQIRRRFITEEKIVIPPPKLVCANIQKAAPNNPFNPNELRRKSQGKLQPIIKAEEFPREYIVLLGPEIKAKAFEKGVCGLFGGGAWGSLSILEAAGEGGYLGMFDDDVLLKVAGMKEVDTIIHRGGLRLEVPHGVNE
ncbi:hypothetical protein EsH8_VI_000776 [Colletotrichum jinshuiense]